MSERDEAIAEVSKYCDLRERLSLVPPSAKARGIYLRSIETVLDREGRLERYRRMFPPVAALPWHPISDFLVRLTVAGAMLTSPAEVHQGMLELGRRNAITFAESLIGRALFRLLSKDPKKLLQQAVAGRRQSISSGSWELSFPSERSAVMRMEEEYLYLESYQLGAARGTFDAISMPVRAEAVLETPFCGRHLLEW